MTHSNKITINAVSLIDLQLKLVKHPNWRILEISRLGFGFRIIFQRRAKKTVCSNVSYEFYSNIPSLRWNYIGCRRFSPTHISVSDESEIHEFFV